MSARPGPRGGYRVSGIPTAISDCDSYALGNTRWQNHVNILCNRLALRDLRGLSNLSRKPVHAFNALV
jgi:hypothetical protein